ncbi:MAG: exodeoxyribonuclease III [Pseudomonadota bacterium]
MRIATWNINSVRLRRHLVARLARLAKPDLICLQETKTLDELFPFKAFARLGYVHQFVDGMKGYNGVAILSRLSLSAPTRRAWCGREDSRHIEAGLPGGIELHNLYVPAGGDIPDPHTNPKFAHKLRFLKEQTAWWRRREPNTKAILVGDLNVAPLPNDVWSHTQLQGVVSHTPVEVAHLGRLRDAYGWIDAARTFVPEPQRLYTWWSYRNRDWKASDRGRRLDHIWVAPALRSNLVAVHILKGARDWPLPSDHVPVVVDLKL